jgi:DNA transposition AAA+ family ATPase
MHKVFVKTGTVKNFISAMGRLQNARPGIPKMCLIHGIYGVGRTQTAIWWAAQHDDCKLIRLVSLIEAPWLLNTIVAEMGQVPERPKDKRFNQLINILLERQYTLIFDEVDYITGDRKSIEMLRDIHDITGTIIVFVGMEDAERKMNRYPHLNDRVMERIKFDKLTIDDIRTAAHELSEVKLTDDAISYIYADAPRFRPLISKIYKAEALARTNSLKEVTAADLQGVKK